MTLLAERCERPLFAIETRLNRDELKAIGANVEMVGPLTPLDHSIATGNPSRQFALRDQSSDQSLHSFF
jgi:hypothetical protein